MPAADALLLAANVVYGTAYVAARLVLDDLPPAFLALVRLAIGTALLVPIARRLERGRPPVPGDGARVAWMGVVGFAAAYALSHWGLTRSTATNAALLIIVEPVSIMLLGPVVLGERLRRREALGAALAVLGALIVVLDGVPGLTRAVAPHWRGDLLLVLAGLAYGAYTLIGRHVLARQPPLTVTAHSIAWGAAAMAPLAALEWLGGARPALTPGGVAGALYLAVVITALGYLLWNWALVRVPAPRAALFLTVQPVTGAVLGAGLLREPASGFTVAGGLLVVAGLWLAVTGRG